MSNKNKNNKRDRRVGNVKELFREHYEGVQNSIEEIVEDELAKLREEFATKVELTEALAKFEEKILNDVKLAVANISQSV